MLSDPKKRQVYDRYGLKGMQEGVQDAGFAGEEFLSQIFGGGLFGGLGGFGGNMRRKQRGEDTVHPLKVSLEDMYNGKMTKLQLSKNVICTTCNGKGGKNGAEQCRACRGHGLKVTYRQIGPGMTQQLHTTCTECQGEGEIINEKDRCKTCNGKKVCNETKILEVHIDEGMKENQKIFFRGEGDQQPGVEPGDVIIVLQLKPHERFQRVGNDLQINHTITLTEALCGFVFIVHHLDGRDLLIKHPPGQVIKPGDMKIVNGEGMPQYKNPFEKGNLYVNFDIKFPDNNFATEDQMKLLESFLPPKPEFHMPVGEHVEEVDLHEYDRDAQRSSSGRGEAYASDDEEHMHGGPGLQCAHQ